MFKPMVAATALLAIVGSSTVYAQQCGHSDARFEQQYRPSTDDVKAFTDARIAALRAGLQHAGAGNELAAVRTGRARLGQVAG